MATDTSSTNLRDGFIFSANPTLNYGVNTGLQIRKTGTATLMRSLISFTLPSLSGTITKITLTLKKSTNLTALGTVRAHMLTQSAWTEGTGDGTATGDGATWNTYNGSTSWTSAGGDFNSTIINSVADATNVGDLLNIDILGGTATNPITATWGDTIHLLLKQATETGGTDTGGIYYSKNDATPGNRPYLTIEYTQGNSNFFMFF